ncbi:transcription regulator [Lactobacillus selangorensis]|uniref:Transcription regulator n=1 Tax=Lactobacillus selangorensis TaxID=81857 RepID=A0A0R2FNI6_9LACO|nr:helix-turn-helix domain-containing protein [Lactobacillus selangorensis]KRN27584.1 transcription regulator [Lactobacillus selangorensis]KRN30143.1 transcription regulator [Lactobacillus selangorensis]
MDIRVLNHLKELTAVEKRQKKERRTSDDLPFDAIDVTSSKSAQVPVLNDYFFKNKSVFISKHNRFAPYPLHSHLFFEINYMLQGSAVETVAGQQINLQQGDILLIDIGTKHAINALGPNDILINLLFRDQNISLELLKKIKSSQSVLYDFLAHQVTSTTASYLLVKNGHTHDVRDTIDTIINEYYLNQDYSDSIIESELSVLLLKLIRNYHLNNADDISPSQQVVIDMLTEIKENYATTSLEKAAAKFAYNKNYLSNLFKAKTHKTFSSALTEERLLRAQDLLHNSKMPISEICERIGISNKTYFYHKYRAYFGCSPAESR